MEAEEILKALTLALLKLVDALSPGDPQDDADTSYEDAVAELRRIAEDHGWA